VFSIETLSLLLRYVIKMNNDLEDQHADILESDYKIDVVLPSRLLLLVRKRSKAIVLISEDLVIVKVVLADEIRFPMRYAFQ
jgi:hypothetical protein